MRRRQAGGPGPGERPPLRYLVPGTLVAFGMLYGVWIALVGQLDRQDDIAGLPVAGVGALVFWVVSVGGRATPSFRRADIGPLLRLGPQLCRQTAGIYVATWRRARHHGPPGGLRSVQTDVGGGGWPAARRSGAVGALLSFTPDAIVVDIDAETGLARVHDFVARPPGPER